MTDESVNETQLLRGVQVTIIRYLGVGLLGFLWTILITRSFSPADAGRLLVLATLPTLIPPLVDLGLPTAVAYFVARRTPNDRLFVGFGIATAVRFGIGIALGAVVFAGIGHLAGAPQVPLFAIGLLSVPFALIIGVASGYLRGHQRFATHARMTTAPMLLLVVGTIVVLQWNGSSSMPVGLVLVIAYAVPATWAYARFHYPTRNRLAKETRNQMLRFALPLFIGDAAGVVRTRGDLVLVAVVLGSASAAVFGAAASIAMQVAIVAQASFIVVFPFARSTETPSESGRLTALAARISMTSTAVLSAGLLVAGPGALAAIFGPEYSASWPVFAAYTPAAILMSVSRVLTSDLSGRGETRFLMVVNLVTALVGVFVVVVFSLLWNLVGAALAVSLTALQGTAWRAHEFKRLTGNAYFTLLGLRKGDIAKVRGSLGSAFGEGKKKC